MMTTTIVYSLAAIAAVICVLCVAGGVSLLQQSMLTERNFKFGRAKLFSDAERTFFERLVAALPGHFVFPHMALPAIVRPNTKTVRMRRIAMRLIAGRRAGFVVCSRDPLAVSCIFEMVSRHGDRDDVESRSVATASAGIATVRFHVDRLPSDSDIAAHVALLEELRERKSSSRGAAESVVVFADFRGPSRAQWS